MKLPSGGRSEAQTTGTCEQILGTLKGCQSVSN
jgi:hypothetical protein